MNRELLELSYALRKKRQKRILSAVLFVLSLFLIVLLTQRFLIFSVREKSLSMQNDIPVGSHIFLTPIVGTPERGDVLMIKRLSREKRQIPSVLLDELLSFITAQQVSASELSSLLGHSLMGQHNMLRRVAALPGDTIYMRGNVLFVKPKGEEYFLTEFERTKKPYNASITALPSSWDTRIGVCADMEEITLKDDEYFLLGDNRTSVMDCRMWGPVTMSNVRARALIVFFPFNKLRLL